MSIAGAGLPDQVANIDMADVQNTYGAFRLLAGTHWRKCMYMQPGEASGNYIA